MKSNNLSKSMQQKEEILSNIEYYRSEIIRLVSKIDNEDILKGIHIIVNDISQEVGIK